jgi:hypothetical protein
VNRLADQASAYLTSAAHQPVHWYPWSDAAFTAARESDRPILLDIGAVWCHWCHVMDGESYEDPDLASYLNEHFVCVKVDRDERPDVDSRYQRAVQALTGQGGWPLTAFLTPSGDVFYGGTYFPPDGKYGRPGLRSVLERVIESYRSRRDQVLATAKQVRTAVADSLIEARPGELSPALLAAGAERMARLFDFRYGGFGTAPKFPHPGAVEFLMARWWDTGEEWMREVVERTLTGMAKGGIHDRVGGGFHRYSVDERWIVPHFEKMSYDNSELLKAYSHAYAALRTTLYREVAEGIIGWALEVLADSENGGFGASQDADVGLHDDGDYFTWTPDEARAVLTTDEWEVACRHWDIRPDGEMHHNPRKNVLWAAADSEAVARDTGATKAEVEALISSAAAKLREARRKRSTPFVDRAIYVSWSSMMAEAFLDSSAALGRADCSDFALKTLERLWEEGYRQGRGMTHRLGAPDGPPMLEDQVQAASAFLSAYEHTGEARWLDRARTLMQVCSARFADAGGGFFDTAAGDGNGFLGERAKPVQDSPTPSPNGVAALSLLRLHAITEEREFQTRAEGALRAFAGSASELGLYAATYLRALDWLLNGECRVVVAIATTTPPDLAAQALATYRPRKAVVLARESPVRGTPPPVAVVCAGGACAAPVTTPEALRETLESFGRRR